MNVNLNNEQLYCEMKEIVQNYNNGKQVDYKDINSKIEKLLHGSESCIEMINNINTISDIDFYNKLEEFAHISEWNDDDCYSVIEMAYNIKFVGEDIIKTTMCEVIQQFEGYGDDYSYFDEEIGINLKILYTEDFKIDNNHYYRVEEIEKLINEKKIVVLCEEERDMGLNKFKKESYHHFESAYDCYSMKYEFFNENGKFFLYTLKYIKEQLSIKKLEELFNEYRKQINFEINEVINGNNLNDKTWSLLAKDYSKEFENDGYALRLKKINENGY